MDQLILELPKALQALSGQGIVGIILAALLGIAMIWANVKYKQMTNEASQAKQTKDQASNAGQNASAEKDAAAAQDGIEKIIAGKDT